MFSTEHVSVAGASEWRYWQREQGLADSFVVAVSRDQTGGLWMVHGDVPAITRFDGRTLSLIESPPLYKRLDSVDGKSGWILDQNGLHRLQDGRWTSFANLNIAIGTLEQQAKVIDIGNSRALLLFPSKLGRITCSPGSGTQSSQSLETIALPQALSKIGTFISFERDPDGGVWLIGQNGAAHFRYDQSGGLDGWEISPLGSLAGSDLVIAIACTNSELFITGINPHSGRSVARRLWHGQWQVVARQKNQSQNLSAWRAAGDLWKSEGNILFRKRGENPSGEWERVDTEGQVLSGKISQVLVNPDGSFFIATSRGLALHVNAAWKAFGSVLDSKGKPIELQQLMSSVLEDRRQRLWFLAQRSLFRFSRGQWDEYNFPKDFQIDLSNPSALGELEDGRILVQLNESPYLATFDPERLTFSSIRFASGSRPVIFSKRSDGRFDVAMAVPEGPYDGLAVLNGDSITDAKPIDGRWDLSFPRAMLRDKRGAFWLGGTSGLFRLADGKYERVPAKNSTADWDPQIAYAFLEQKSGELLVGGRKGLYRWTGKQLELVTDHIETARKIIQDRSGTIWAASGSGVFRDFHGEAGGRVSAGRDWFGNDEADGLPSSVAQSLVEDSEGQVWAATTRGPAVFRPNTDKDEPQPIVPADENSNETPSSGRIEIIFSGEDKWNLTPAGLLQFSHRLDGGTWSQFSESKIAKFRGIAIGKHEFEVVALDRSGNSSASSARFSFSVLAPWYRTTGFLIIFSLTLIAIGYLGWLAIRHLGQLKVLANVDGLTSNWNRRAIFRLLTRELEQAKRKASMVAVIMIDVDQFKNINDRCGHPVGDLVLQEVARRLRSCTRPSDHLGRYGGEEFLVILPSCRGPNAIARAEELRRVVECRPFSIGADDLLITCSLGVNWTKEGSYDLRQLLCEADAALYQAKHGGRNRVRIAPEPNPA
jgi:diguanylate cyclase (GGDEF)-like protein